MKTLQGIITNIVVGVISLSIGLAVNYLKDTIDFLSVIFILLVFVIIAGATGFLYVIGQVNNHIPTEIQEVRKEVKEIRKEMREGFTEMRGEMREGFTEMRSYLMDKNNKV